MEDLIDNSIKIRLSEIIIVGITGARVNDVDSLLSQLGKLGEFQLMDARLILSEEHVRFACYEALRSFSVGQNVASTLTMEILVKAACTNQISEAISRLGVKRGCKELVLVAVKADESSIKRAIGLTGGTWSQSPLRIRPDKEERIRKAFSLEEPVEKTLLENIALSGLG